MPLAKVSFFFSIFFEFEFLTPFIAVTFLEKAVQLPGIKYIGEGEEGVVNSYGVVSTRKLSPLSEAWKLMKGDDTFLGKFGMEVSMHRNWQREMDGLITQVAY